MRCTGASRRPRQTRTIPSTSALIQKKAEEREAVVSECFVHALLALCCVMSTMPPIGQLVGVLKCLIKLMFTLGPIGLGPKTSIFWALKSALAKNMHLTPKYLKTVNYDCCKV